MQHSILAVPESNGEHPHEFLDRRFEPPLSDRGQHDFSVGVTAEAVTPGFQFPPQAREVIDLAVENHDVAPAGREHWLMAFR